MIKLELANISAKILNIILWSGLNITLNSGDCFCITGANGSGKTSLLRIIAGLKKTDSGDINFFIDRKKFDRKKFCHLISTLPAMKSDLTVLENFIFWQKKLKSQENIFTIIDRLKLREYKNITFSKLSSGQQKRASFARLLLSERPIWLLDEPFLHLDLAGRHLLLELIAEQQAKGCIICLSSNITNFLSELKNPRKINLQKLCQIT